MNAKINRTAGAVLLLALSMSAGSETIGCTEISATPTTITAPGLYCLKSDLIVTSNSAFAGIRVVADDVVIDLNGHLLDGSSLGSGTHHSGIVAFGRRHITVRNGTVRGFLVGVSLDVETPETDNGQYLVEKLQLDHNYSMGIRVRGDRSIVRDNIVLATGGSPSGGAVGIHVVGRTLRVTDNEVLDTVEGAGGGATGIAATQAPMAVIERNTVRNAALGPLSSRGIEAGSGSIVVGNRVINMRIGILFAGGINAKAVYKDNIVGGAAIAFSAPPLAPGAINFVF
jgi:hypothetical protein